MKFSVLTLFPEIISGYCSESIIKRACDKKIISLEIINPRDFTLDKHKKVDDTPYGGGAGMVLMPQPFVDAYESIEQLSNPQTIMLTPQGEPFTNSLSDELAKLNHIILICGHYEGFDERIRQIIKPREISIGDFVLTGGELPALCVIDAVSRKIEGTLGKLDSAKHDSFSSGLLEHSQYTRPREYRGLKVPDILLSGNHEEISKFRLKESIERTKLKRPDLYKQWQDKNN